jgi:hypothetical protein
VVSAEAEPVAVGKKNYGNKKQETGLRKLEASTPVPIVPIAIGIGTQHKNLKQSEVGSWNFF